jgi:UDP-N-acetylmuramoylalanine--D-glutamate ligase
LTLDSRLSAWLGGNIGGSLLPVIDEIAPGDPVVLELSSFQLTDLDRLQVSPKIAVITNFAPNHLDWHDTLAHYRWAKQTMLRWQSADDVAVLNADDPDVRAWPVRGRRWLFGLTDHGGDGTFLREDNAVWRCDGREDLFPIRSWLKLPGRHNLANALAASAAALARGASLEHVRIGLEQYEPLPHRLQFVGEVQGRKFYNDSLATTPESAIVGMQSFQEPVILLAGGYDKHVDLTEMAQAIAGSAKAVALMGQTGPRLRDLVRGWHAQRLCDGRGDASQTTPFPERQGVPRLSDPMPDFPSALDWAWRQSSPGDVILLSPGCASYDWFRNFADRGERFVEWVEALEQCRASRADSE